ncbi:carotenoid 9,10(9',10')-cleavage dioxygenase isoform X2 [Selaginella moellendorffii]|uniref:carotenoid 9,10(9',10')-cleavage dioxygenase isoform X2 n=1 Tax=Selaginella moellendorffii TaxID=88036 RepID=UPI000D1C5FC3|nr:carotenoid 9,10(9',10')-cleavage dioxygenase isoform X2 [Selaginella moellendorffii]XP_024521255.1 carotenoid 9,10(9',10')-cleavage dioxygenase isoform X2 [Selaginella moellendorffii]|eukprot:XP_024520615.1 carotenoid 9,10(9',10')-cleavage dioxygenase isoform X2 [Selaginella moellendorffii]
MASIVAGTFHQATPNLSPVATKACQVTGNGALATRKVPPFLKSLFHTSRNKFLDVLVDALYKPDKERNIYYQENFSPVEEVGSWTPVQVIDGEIPQDFPAGTYIRNGPNPYLLDESILISPFGKLYCHWFEGDGMLHATRFDQGGKFITYKNKYVDTMAHKIEKNTKKTSFLRAVEGDSLAISASYLLNFLRFGKVNGPTCNTHVFKLAGKLYAVAEADIPHEIDLSSLNTLGTLDFSGKWKGPFTSHSKFDLEKQELVIFGFNAKSPYLQIGIVSKDGDLIQKTDLELDRACFIHEISITKNYTLIPDFPLTINMNRLLKGSGRLVEFENNSSSRIGVMPRYGDSKSVRWFEVEPGYSFHAVNAFEDSDEIVLHALFSKIPFFPTPNGVDRREWFARGITPTDPRNARDPQVDGALLANLREWRFNLDKGTVVERNLTSLETCGIEMPKINKKFTGRKNQFAYAQVVDVEASKVVGMPKYGKFMKVKLPESCEDEIDVKYHDLGANRYGSEPLFVARPHSTDEDDGWIVSYVHDEETNKSEVYIFDAQKFQDQAVARIGLPQRVPYGFHSDFFF